MRKLIAAVLFLALFSPADAQHVTEAGLENRDYKARIRVVASDPDGGVCSLTSPPTIQAFDNSSTMEFFCCTAATWSQCDPGGGGDVVGPAGPVLDNEIVRFDSTTGKIIQGYTSDGPTISDLGFLATNKIFTVASLTPGIDLKETDTADEDYRITVQDGDLVLSRITDAGGAVAEIAKFQGGAVNGGFVWTDAGVLQLAAGTDVTIGGVSTCLEDGTNCNLPNTCAAEAGTIGAKIEACLAAAAAGDGICDCRSETGTQAFTGPITIDESDVTLLLGNVDMENDADTDVFDITGDRVTVTGSGALVTRVNQSSAMGDTNSFHILGDNVLVEHLGGSGTVEDYGPSGTATGGTGGTILVDVGAAWTDDYWIGRTVTNVTDAESCTITDNDSNSITCDGLATATWSGKVYDIGSDSYKGGYFIVAEQDAITPHLRFLDISRAYKCVELKDITGAIVEYVKCDYTVATAINCGGPGPNRCRDAQIRHNIVTNACIENIDDGTVNTNCAGVNSIQTVGDSASEFQVEYNHISSWGHGIKMISLAESGWTVRGNVIDNYDLWVLNHGETGAGGELFDGYGIFIEGAAQVTDNYTNYTFGEGIRFERAPNGVVISGNDVNNANTDESATGGPGVLVASCSNSSGICRTGGDSGAASDIVVVANNCKNRDANACSGANDYPCIEECVELDIDTTGTSTGSIAGCTVVGNGGIGLSNGPVVIDAAATDCYQSMNGDNPQPNVGTDPPATCALGQFWLDTDGSTTAANCAGGAAGVARICACTAADTWTGL